MALRYTTDEAIAAVRTSAFLPPVGGMTDAEILVFLNQVRTTTMAELVKRASPSYWRTYADFTLAVGQSEYRVPDRALMNTIDSAVQIESGSTREKELVELEADQRWKYAVGGRDPYWPGDFAYIMEGEHLRVVPTPTSREAGQTLRVYYARQPSRMVKLEEALGIDLALSTTELDIGVVGANTAANGLQVLDTYADVVRGAGMFGPIAVDRIVKLNYASPVLTFSGTTPIVVADVMTYVPGRRRDYVCLAGETVFPEYPSDLWDTLICAATVQVLIAQKDFAHADAANVKLESFIRASTFLAEPRSKEPEVIINRNSALRRGRWRR